MLDWNCADKSRNVQPTLSGVQRRKPASEFAEPFIRRLPSVIVGILLRKGGPFFWKIVGRIDGRDRAHGNARAAVNAFDRIDKELIYLGKIGRAHV